MVLTTINKPKQILVITFAGHVGVNGIAEESKDVRALISELEPGFRLLADLTALQTMAIDCAPEITKIMDLCAESGVKLIVRVIPDPTKDIGFSILSRFHYPNKPRTVICKTLVEAAKLLDLS
jgi:hypothetical protein